MRVIIKMSKMVCFMVLIILLSCSEDDIDFERTNISVRGQQIEILTAYKIFDNYLLNKRDYNRNIYRRIEREFKEDAEYPFLLETIQRDIKPDEKLKEELEILKDIDFKRIVDSAFRIIAKELQGPGTKILFIPANPEYRELYKRFGMGIHAVTLGTGKILVSIDPTFDNWPQLIPYVLAHEHHHSVWTSRNFETPDFTPLEYLVLEGKADSFARGLFPNAIIPWFNMLTEDEEKRVWNLVRPELNVRNSKMNDNMMIGTDVIPYASGYAIGFSIIESFRKNNPQINDIELIDIKPEQILLLSKYDEN